VKVNKMCGYRGFKVISDERAPGDGPFSVNFGPLKLTFKPAERGDQGLPNEPLFSFLGPKVAFFRATENTLKDRKRHPVADGP